MKYLRITSELIIFSLASLMLLQFVVITIAGLTTGYYVTVYTNLFNEHYPELLVFLFFYSVYVYYKLNDLKEYEIRRKIDG